MSITSMMTARLRGIRMSWVGVASATVNSPRPSSDTAIGRCRHHGCGTCASVNRCRRRRRRSLDEDVDGEQGQRNQGEQQHGRTLEPVQRQWADAGQRHCDSPLLLAVDGALTTQRYSRRSRPSTNCSSFSHSRTAAEYGAAGLSTEPGSST